MKVLVPLSPDQIETLLSSLSAWRQEFAVSSEGWSDVDEVERVLTAALDDARKLP